MTGCNVICFLFSRSSIISNEIDGNELNPQYTYKSLDFNNKKKGFRKLTNYIPFGRHLTINVASTCELYIWVVIVLSSD